MSERRADPVLRVRLVPLLIVALSVAGCDTPPNTPVHDGAAEVGAEEARAPRTVPDSTPGPPSARELARSAASPAALRPVDTEWSDGDAAAGAAVYAANCVTCHGADGRGRGESAAALNPKPRDFTSGVYYIDGNADAETGSDVDLARVIAWGPGTFGGSSAMPPWQRVLSDEEIRNVVAYIQSLSG